MVSLDVFRSGLDFVSDINLGDWTGLKVDMGFDALVLHQATPEPNIAATIQILIGKYPSYVDIR